MEKPETTKALAEQIDKMTPLQELEDQAVDVLFQTSVGCASLIRYLCEHINGLPLSVMTRFIDTHDLLLAIVPIIEVMPPACRQHVAIHPRPSLACRTHPGPGARRRGSGKS